MTSLSDRQIERQTETHQDRKKVGSIDKVGQLNVLAIDKYTLWLRIDDECN